MVSIDQLKSDQADAADTAKALGLEAEPLTDAELDKFGRSFERQFVLGMTYREIIDILNRHRAEILMGAMVATKQFASRFDGERPEAGKFGMTEIRAGWLGIGDDWEDITLYSSATVLQFTGGALQNWIHSGTNLMTGTAGNAVKIGKNAVHVIVGVGDYYEDSKLESLQFTIDGKPKPGITMKRAIMLSDFKTKELDVAFILKYKTTILGKVFQKPTDTAYPYLLGATFVPENILREYVDPASLPGATNDFILTT